jgi:hypothetical protein
MSRCPVPPFSTTAIDVSQDSNSGTFMPNWAQWFISLYSSLGGTTGTGALFLSNTIPSVTASTKLYLIMPRAGKITQIFVCLQGTLSNHIETINASNGASSMGSVNFSANAAAGTVVNFSPTSNNIVTAGQSISVNSSALSSNAVAALVTLVFEYTA